MKEFLSELVAKENDPRDKRNIAREYLQAILLRIIHEMGLFDVLYFMGGTALRFIYNLPRFSEDLDFSLDTPRQDVLLEILRRARNELSESGYDVSTTLSNKTAVHKAFVKFRGLLYDMGATPNASENFSIKIEIDTKPPAGARLETSVIQKFFPFAIRHPDPSTLFAGKIAALLGRSYAKGRDYYDFMWYRTRWPDLEPNIRYLNSSVSQTKPDTPLLAENSWKPLLEKKFRSVSWEVIQRDVGPFLERPADRSLLTLENFLKFFGEKP